jgi:L-ascorbate metabolism protein UlaG (beta-lactamase superfamily)
MPISIKTVQPGEKFIHDPAVIEVVQADNTEQGNSTKKQHKKGDGVDYLITLSGKTIHHAGDTDFIPEMHELGRVDLALLPVGGTDTMDLAEAAAALIAINPCAMIPMHRIGADLEELVGLVEARSRIQILPLAVGNSYSFT